jgi:hypothetical protein
MRSLFPTGLFNASLDFPEVRLARGSPLEPARPASASQRRLPVDLISVPNPGQVLETHRIHPQFTEQLQGGRWHVV